MKLTLRTLTRWIAHPFFALLIFLAASPAARAIAIFPANVQNNTSVAVEIAVVRVQTRLGSPATTNETKVTIQPGRHASVMLMGGTFGTGASHTKQITISEVATPGGQPAAKPIAPPLVLDNPTSTMAREFVVDLDAKAGKFKFEPLPAKTTEAQASPDGTRSESELVEIQPADPQAASKVYIVNLDPSTDTRAETARLETAYSFKATYVHTAAAHGFAAALSQAQVGKLGSERTVLTIQPDRAVHLDSN